MTILGLTAADAFSLARGLPLDDEHMHDSQFREDTLSFEFDLAIKKALRARVDLPDETLDLLAKIATGAFLRGIQASDRNDQIMVRFPNPQRVAVDPLGLGNDALRMLTAGDAVTTLLPTIRVGYGVSFTDPLAWEARLDVHFGTLARSPLEALREALDQSLPDVQRALRLDGASSYVVTIQLEALLNSSYELQAIQQHVRSFKLRNNLLSEPWGLWEASWSYRDGNSTSIKGNDVMALLREVLGRVAGDPP